MFTFLPLFSSNKLLLTLTLNIEQKFFKWNHCKVGSRVPNIVVASSISNYSEIAATHRLFKARVRVQ